MAITAEELNIILSAKDREFNKKINAANRRVRNFAYQSRKNLKQTSLGFADLTNAIGKLGIALSAGAIVTGFSRSLESAFKFSKEIDNLSTLAGVGAEEFQRFSFASKQVGVEQDKVADILKDVNDKFGDFFVTGAGPLADFFENIAPKVGITADAFKDLSSAEALGLYVKTLEEAGVNQQQLTFFMEALASDATLLAPLLRDNGRAMFELGEEAKNLGLILDEDLISSTADLEREWAKVVERMTTKWRTFTLSVGMGLADIFNISDRGQLDSLRVRMENLVNTRKSFEAEEDVLMRTIKNEQEKGNTAQAAIFESNLKVLQKNLRQNLKNIMSLKKEIEAFGPDVFDLGTIVVPQTKGSEDPETKVKNIRNELQLLGGAMDDLTSISATLERGFEDVFMAAIDGSKSFKDTLSSTTQAIIRELYRVLVVQRLVNATMGFLGINPATSSFMPNTNFAAGGYMQAGQAAVVGEHGREIFVPSQSGRVLSVGQAQSAVSGGEGVTINQTINVTTGVQQTVRNEIKTMLPQIAESAKAAVADSKRRGGSFGRAFS